MRAVVVVVVAWVVMLAAGSARATPLVDPHVGGMVFVGPTSPHPSALYWNPAAASLLKGGHLSALGDVRLDWSQVARDAIDTGTGEPSATGDRSFPSTSYLALTETGFAGGVFDLGTDRITLGLGFYQPFAEETPDGDAQTGYHSLAGSFHADALTLSTSVRINGTASIGFGISLLSTRVKTSFLRDTALDTCAQTPCSPRIEDPAHAQRIAIDTGFNLPWNSPLLTVNLGLLLHLGDWIVGAAFITPPATSVLSGYVVQRDDIEATITQAGGNFPVQSGARVTLRLPWTIHFGVRHRLFGDWDALLNLRVQNLSIYDKTQIQFYGAGYRSLGVPDTLQRWRGLSDVFSVELGLEDQPGKTVRLGGRLRFEGATVPESSVAFDQIDAAKLELAAGAELRISPSFALVLGASGVALLPVTVAESAYTPSAQIRCNASAFDLDACTDARAGRGIPTSAGSYQKLGAELSLGISVDWW